MDDNLVEIKETIEYPHPLTEVKRVKALAALLMLDEAMKQNVLEAKYWHEAYLASEECVRELRKAFRDCLDCLPPSPRSPNGSDED